MGQYSTTRPTSAPVITGTATLNSTIFFLYRSCTKLHNKNNNNLISFIPTKLYHNKPLCIVLTTAIRRTYFITL